MAGPLADIVLAEEPDKRIEIVRVESGAHTFEQRKHGQSLPNDLEERKEPVGSFLVSSAVRPG